MLDLWSACRVESYPLARQPSPAILRSELTVRVRLELATDLSLAYSGLYIVLYVYF